ncbi:MAG: YdeI family protein [Chitinophagales bacterium]
MSVIFFTTGSEFRKWLIKHHNREQALLVGFYKVSSGKLSITWAQAVDQALCFGWIDGITKSIDEESYCIRFTPRKNTSNWSIINIKKVEEFIKTGLMSPAGLKAFNSRKEKSTGVYAHEKESIILNPNYVSQFKKHKRAWTFFISQRPSYKKAMMHWIMNAKQEKTRLIRLEKTIKMSDEQKRIQ